MPFAELGQRVENAARGFVRKIAPVNGEYLVFHGEYHRTKPSWMDLFLEDLSPVGMGVELFRLEDQWQAQREQREREMDEMEARMIERSERRGFYNGRIDKNGEVSEVDLTGFI